MGAPRTKLFVGHLPDGCTNDELQALFEKYGTVKECDVINKYGFVHMSTPEEAQDAIKALNNYTFRGSSLSVEPSKSKLHPEPGAPGRAKGGTSRGSRGNYGGGYGGPQRGSGFANGYRGRFDGPSFGGGRDFYPERPYGGSMSSRMRPYPMPYERHSLSMGLRDEYDYRSSLYSVPSRDPYARPSIPPRDLYERRPSSYPTASDYLYSRRSPPPPISAPSRSYWYSDGIGEISEMGLKPSLYY
ncbi:RNA-binding protein lark-like isoform X2 [Stegodyphus dumicola]|uniref:RNA-binding protein lark-like isoform X2 n=1 Tax=Stegodyphus dumicola TaxID=202533 RepID=UPI0015AD846B|nr:RNA-binding protein lark-like isoform X2 [Stegodyphus dumicola]